MIIYEVNLEVDNSVADEYAEWLRGHIAEILTLPGFLSAEWLDDVDLPAEARVRWSIRYRLESEEAMQRYFDEFAEEMRADGMKRFAGRFEASRRVLQVREAFGAFGRS